MPAGTATRWVEAHYHETRVPPGTDQVGVDDGDSGRRNTRRGGGCHRKKIKTLSHLLRVAGRGGDAEQDKHGHERGTELRHGAGAGGCGGRSGRRRAGRPTRESLPVR